MKEYMFLLREGENSMEDLSPEQLQKHVNNYSRWIKQLTEEGVFKNAQPLEREGKVISGKNREVVTDGPFVESKEIVAGLFIIQANDLSHAFEIAKGCPILEFDGIVEIRPIAADVAVNLHEQTK